MFVILNISREIEKKNTNHDYYFVVYALPVSHWTRYFNQWNKYTQ